mmetsp:Transcript_81249/g.159486  ORF Transcript_81249/g.159486 Transcript_81249/m.159486 type:complete len:134 (-) Transcript_81249:401-802(-)
MSKVTQEEKIDLTSLESADLEMRNTKGLTRRTFASQEEGGNSEEDRDDFLKVTTPAHPVALSPSFYRDVIKYIGRCSANAYFLAIGITFAMILHSTSEFRENNTVFNFLHVYFTITLMILAIMGVMNALKIEH